MPLHLLSTKSWNVYAPGNIARVRRDQTAAQAHEEEEDRQLQEQDSIVRLALLRGDAPAVAGSEVEVRAKNDREPSNRDERRKRRQIRGEDDTDRDLRLAREDLKSMHKQPEKRHETHKHQQIADAPITDRAGYINLFPNQGQQTIQDHKNAEVEKGKVRKQRELEDQYTMRFSDVAERGLSAADPWYATDKQRKQVDMEVVEGKDVWGRPDPAAKGREQGRQVSNDPLAFMQTAQLQLKQSKRDRQRWQREEQGKRPSFGKHENQVQEDRRRERDRSRDGDRERKKQCRHRDSPLDGHRSAQEQLDGSRRNAGRQSASPHGKHRLQHREARIDRVPKVSNNFRLDG